EGFVILATNKKANIDEAFGRRIRHSVEFFKPNKSERHALWAHFIGLLFEDQNLEPDALASIEKYELSPAQIKSAVLSARYLTLRDNHPMHLNHLLSGLARELRKEGRSLAPELAQLLQTNVTEVADVA
ncbi:MAG: hypothetical protein AAF412_14310, partial [Pseudomonadota bacterium]